MQGGMGAADYHLGVRCNLEFVGQAGPGVGRFRTHRYPVVTGSLSTPAPPGTPAAPYRALSSPTFAPERNEIWYTDGNYGFFALRLR